jgi:large subunit ribosomal protein L3
MAYIIGQKIGMTHRFNDQGHMIPLTVILAEPNTVIQVKSKTTDGYSAVTCAAGDKKPKNINKPITGQLKAGQIESAAIVREFANPKTSELKTGDKITLDQFKAGDILSITGVTKGKGFTGVIKRHGFHRGPETHGSDHHRAPGSIGGGYPQRVVQGKKMPGHVGNTNTTLTGIQVADIIKDDHLILVKGSVPGAKKSWLIIETI